MTWPVDTPRRLWLYRRPTDLRKSYDGLAALVRHALHEDPLGGEVFVFVNRRRTQMRCLYFAGDGFCLWSKRLERGRFQVSFEKAQKQPLEYTAWRMMIDGIDLRSVRRLKRYHRHGGDRQLIASSVP